MAKSTKNTPPINTARDVASAEECLTLIRKALKKQQTYSEALEPTMKMAAGNYHAYLKTLASMEHHKKVMYPIETREGSKAYKLYPDFEYLPVITRALQLSLKSLGLTLDTLAQADEDPLEALANAVNGEIDNG